MYDALVYIGRFQPFHLGHQGMVMAGLSQAKRLILLLGSANSPQSRKNPWTFEQRVLMIQSALPTETTERLTFIPLNDCPDDDAAWQRQVMAKVHAAFAPDERFALMGYHKDESSYYLHLFPEWDYVDFPSQGEISATPIRECYFNAPLTQPFAHPHLCPAVLEYLNHFRTTPTFHALTQSALSSPLTQGA